MRKKIQAHIKGRIVFLPLILTFSFLILIFLSYHLAYWGKAYPGVVIINQPVGNKTISETIANCELRIANLKTDKIILTYNNQQWEINLAELNFSYDATVTAKKAFKIGRDKNPVINFQTKVQAWFKGINLGMEYSLDQSLLDTQISTISGEIFIPAIEPTIKLVDKKIIVEPGKNGQELNKEKLLSIINYQLSIINFSSIELTVIQLSPKLTPDQVENTRGRAEKFSNKKLILLGDETNQWELGGEDLIGFFSFTNGFDQEKIASWSANLASTINHPPENAAFQFVEGRVTEFRPAKEGKTLDQQKMIDIITQNLIKLESGEDKITVHLPIIVTPSAIQTADVNTLGIRQLVGKGVSYFRGSISSRIHNIQLASTKLNGILIPPGEIFSFNKALGEVSQTTGFKEAYIIKEGRTILGDGGGVCQVSTTLFRAALDVGLPIIERQAHAYRVSYYEQNSPVGLDATVFDPTADLKFKNDTPAYILIQAKVDVKNKILTFELYGTTDGRVVSISKSRIWDQVPPPPDLYQDDPTLPTGQIKQIDWKAWGAKVSFDYKVERPARNASRSEAGGGGEVLQNRTFYSNYRPWQAIYLRGIGAAQ
ncbi:hypothetical protein CO054_01460 [Candidatus Shapirobacteria bacterium CG_4_9_14_0_2_um_filter_39_11]|uniref:YoaR-like putative peptidoglycan binding domain-containing protein n=1 Tax=Candidatus Shapirobacteria bacterium CG_4_9_14_0_2_um_filter_39_11 TaxID=1974478 RepID=A0A2M8ESU3_9BACT|nr:MAG: hypothetical protein CO054_01460 [Candidatus Shapirobacteria bacterium CG_4_9_14_0_2_um_filter_39_11]